MHPLNNVTLLRLDLKLVRVEEVILARLSVPVSRLLVALSSEEVFLK